MDESPRRDRDRAGTRRRGSDATSSETLEDVEKDEESSGATGGDETPIPSPDGSLADRDNMNTPDQIDSEWADSSRSSNRQLSQDVRKQGLDEL